MRFILFYSDFFLSLYPHTYFHSLGNSLSLSRSPSLTNFIKYSSLSFSSRRHNAKIYGVEKNIEFIVGDAIDILPTLKADVVYLSPPWVKPKSESNHFFKNLTISFSFSQGGPEYLNADTFDIRSISLKNGVNGKDLFHMSRKVTPNIAYYLPRNIEKAQIHEMMRESIQRDKESVKESSTIDVEEEGGISLQEEKLSCEMQTEKMNGKPKAITVYFGELVSHTGSSSSTKNKKRKKKKK